VDTDRGRLGELGIRAPDETEASTGRSLTEPGSPARKSEVEAAQKQAPLLRQELPESEATTGPNAPTDIGRGRMGELGVNAPAESEATTGVQMTKPGKPGRAAQPLDIVQAVADA